MTTLASPTYPLSSRTDSASSAPWLSLTIALLAILAFPFSGSIEASRDAVYAGELWRLVAGHLAHFSPSHLAWDVLTFVVLASFVERRGRAILIATIGVSALVIPVAVAIMHPSLTSYRGLSGIDSALFTAAMTLLLWESTRDRDAFRFTAAAIGLVLFGAKLIYEVVSGNTLFVDPAANNFTPVPIAHLVGGLWGAAVACVYSARSIQPPPRTTSPS